MSGGGGNDCMVAPVSGTCQFRELQTENNKGQHSPFQYLQVHVFLSFCVVTSLLSLPKEIKIYLSIIVNQIT